MHSRSALPRTAASPESSPAGREAGQHMVSKEGEQEKEARKGAASQISDPGQWAARQEEEGRACYRCEATAPTMHSW